MPPTPFYMLEPSNEKLVGKQMGEFAYERRVGGGYYVHEWVVASVDAQRSLRGWLTTLGGRDTARACTFLFEKRVAWSSKTALRRMVTTQQAEVRRRFGAMVRELERGHLLPAGEIARSSAQFALTLLDHRGDQRQPLPTVEWLLGDG